MKILFLIVLLFFPKHDFHTSLTEINFNSKTASLEISVRVFTDDLDLALSAFSNQKTTINLSEALLNPLIEQYFRKNLALISPDKNVKFAKYYGKEKEADATWLYFEIFDCNEIGTFQLYNSIMQELFKDQTNLVNIIYPNKKKTLVFDSEKKLLDWPF
jgi:hypothetical protein